MNFAEMKSLLEYYVDDVLDTADVVRLFNMGKNRMAEIAHATFPDITPSAPGDTFVFDSKFHEMPVLYAAAMVKANDSSNSEKESFMTQFEIKLRDFVQDYDAPVQYQNGEYMQHFTITDAAGETDFIVTRESFNGYSNLSTYIDGHEVAYSEVNGRSVRLSTPAFPPSTVTIVWSPNIYGNRIPNWVRAW